MMSMMHMLAIEVVSLVMVVDMPGLC